MSLKKLFSVKDKVFVKRRAYPAWPALIIGIKDNTESEVIYTVYFYGTGNYGEYKANSLCLYEENKYKLAKPRRKQKKFKKLAEALELIENDTKNEFVPDNNVEVFVQPISTTNINQELSLEDESKNVSKIENQSEYNSKTEEMLTYEPVNESSSSKSMKVVLRKRVSNSAKRKLSDVTHEKVPKKLKISKSFKHIDVQPIVLLEPLNNVYLQRKLNGKQNFETAEKNVTVNEQISETLNTTLSVLESSDVSLNHCEMAESITINESVQSDLGRISRFGRKIKPNRLSDHDFVTNVPKNLKLKKADSKSLKTLEIDNSLKQNVKTTDSSTKTKAIKKLKNNLISIPVSIPCSLDSVSKKICLVNNSLHEKNPPNNLIQNSMGSLSNVEVECKQMESNKADKVNLLLTEVNLLDCVNKLSSALSINYSKLSYEMALKSLKEISELQFNALMLIKHRCIIDKITKVTKYVGDVNNWSLSDQEAIEHVDKAHQIRCKARKVLNKCISLFTLTDGKTFQEIYNQEVDLFIAKTQHLSNDQIYGCTSDKLYK